MQIKKEVFHMSNNHQYSQNEKGQPICITGKNPYGLCSCCHYDGIQCCISCSDKNDCNIVCGYIDN